MTCTLKKTKHSSKRELLIERFHSHGLQLWKYIGTKERFYMKKVQLSLSLVLDPNIITETRQLIVVDRENANKWKMTERVPCGSFSWSLFLLGHPQHLTIIRRRIELHTTNNYFSVLNNCLNLTRLACNYLLFNALGKVRFLLGGGGGGGRGFGGGGPW